jgi:putative phage-type endonuclease
MQNVQTPIVEETCSDGIFQGTPEWHASRLGKATASRIADIMARTKSGYGASRANYMADLICERLTGVPTNGFISQAMQVGIDRECDARAMYAFLRDVSVELVGFIDHPTLSMSGASPDGMVGSDGLVEIKCPTAKTHLDTLLGASIPDKYIKQIMWQLACTGRQWCDFVSYNSDLPAEMQLHIERVTRDDGMIKDIESEVRKFLDEIADKVERLRAKYLTQEAAE